MRTAACIIARNSSTRLPGKVLQELGGSPLLGYLIQRIRRVRGVDSVYVCTSDDPADQSLIDLAEKEGVKAFAGDPDHVASRLQHVAELEDADAVVRITGDNPFTDETYIELMLEEYKERNVKYTRTESLPLGCTAEVISVDILNDYLKHRDQGFSQYLMLYLFEPWAHACLCLEPPSEHRRPAWSLTVDSADDLERVKSILAHSGMRFPHIGQIIEAGEKYNLIPERAENDDLLIKLPAGIRFTHASLREELRRRQSRSERVAVSPERYLNTHAALKN